MSALRRLPALVLHQARYDARAFLRNRQARFSTLILPPLLLAVFVSGFGGGGGAEGAADRVPGIAALGALAACFANLAVAITAQREAGILKRRRATPVPASALVIGRTLTAMGAALVATAAVCTLGRAAYGVALPVTAIPPLVLTVALASICFAALAHALSSAIRSTDAAQPLVQAIALPLYVASGVFVPAGDLPSWLHDLGELFPLAHVVDALGTALPGGGFAWGDAAVLTAWTAAGLAIALHRFRWTPATAGA